MRAEVYRLLRGWTETTATWNRPATGQTWAQAGAQGVGADRYATLVAATNVQATGRWYAFDVTAAVQAWLANPGSNYGLLLQAAAATNTPNFEERFASREATDATKRPKLTIDYAGQTTATPTRTASPTTTSTPTRTASPTTSASTSTPTPTATATPSQSQQAVLQSGVNGYTGATDASLDSWLPDTNSGVENLLRLRYNDGTTVKTHMAPVLRFDVTSIPAQAQVTSARLESHLAESGSGQLRHARRSVPAAARLDRNHRHLESPRHRPDLGASRRTGVGADYNAALVAATNVQATGRWYAFDVTAAVQAWLANPGSNYGLLLQAAAATNTSNFEERFASREATDATKRPKLTIDYSVSIPKQAVLQGGVSGYTGATDTTLNSWSPDANSGADTLLHLRYNGSTTVKTHMAPVLRFDVTSIPAQAQLTSARLELYLAESGSANSDMRAEVYRLLRGWTETTATWNRPATGQTWAQAGAQGVGADYNATLVAATNVQATGRWYAFDVTAAVKPGWRTPAATTACSCRRRPPPTRRTSRSASPVARPPMRPNAPS